MAASLYLLRDFFKAGRKPNGGYMGKNIGLMHMNDMGLVESYEAVR